MKLHLSLYPKRKAVKKMPILNEAIFKKELADRKIHNLYVFCGNEPYLKDFYLKKLIDLIVAGPAQSFNFRQIDGDAAEISALEDAVTMMPLMSEYTCCLVKDFPLASLNSQNAKKLNEILSQIPQSSVIIFYLRDENFPPKAKREASEEESGDKEKKKAQKELFAFLSDKATIAKLDHREEGQLISLLCSGAKKRGCELSTANAKLLISLCGNDLNTLLHELEKLSIYVGTGEITAELIRRLAIRTLEATAFEIAENLLSGRCDKAIHTLQILNEQKVDVQILFGSLIFPFTDIYRVKLAEQAGKRLTDLTKIFSYSGTFRLEKAKRNGRNISLQKIRSCLAILNQADIRLKTTGLPATLLLEETFVKLSENLC